MTVDLSITSKKTVGKRIAANTGLMLGAKFAGVLLGLATLKVTTHYLSPAEFGTVIFLHAYMLFFAEVATFTSWQSIIRFGTDDLKGENVKSLSRLLKFGAILDFISVVFAYLASVALFGFVVWLVAVFPTLAPEEGLPVETCLLYTSPSPRD